MRARNGGFLVCTSGFLQEAQASHCFYSFPDRRLRQREKSSRQTSNACDIIKMTRIIAADHREPLAASAQSPPSISNISFSVSVCIRSSLERSVPYPVAEK